MQLNARNTATLAAGIISALLALAAIRGLPLGGVLFWFAPLPLYALAFSFGAAATTGALGIGGLVTIVSGGAGPALAWVVLFGLPAMVFSTLAMRGPPPAPPAQANPAQANPAQANPEGLPVPHPMPHPGMPALALSLPFALLALWPATLLLGAEIVLSGQPGGLSAALGRAVETQLSAMGMPEDVATAELVETMVRLKPLVFAIVFAAITVANASIAQNFVARRGLLVTAPARWSEASLPRWYWPVAVVPALVAGLAPGEAGFFATALAMMLAVPLVLQGLAVVHVISQGRPARPLLLTALYVGLLLLTVPVGLGLAGLGLAEFFVRLRARAQGRSQGPFQGGGQSGRQPPDD